VVLVLIVTPVAVRVEVVGGSTGGLQPPLRAATSIGTRGARGGESEGRRRRRGRRRLQPPYGCDLDPPLDMHAPCYL